MNDSFHALLIRNLKSLILAHQKFMDFVQQLCSPHSTTYSKWSHNVLGHGIPFFKPPLQEKMLHNITILCVPNSLSLFEKEKQTIFSTKNSGEINFAGLVGFFVHASAWNGPSLLEGRTRKVFISN